MISTSFVLIMDDNTASVIRSNILYKRDSLESGDQSWSSFDESDRICGKLLWKLDSDSLSQLRRYFHRQNENSKTENSVENRRLFINRKEFEDAISVLLDDSKHSLDASKLFQILDFDSTGFIWWDQILDQLVECGEKRTRKTLDGWTPVVKNKINILDLAHCKKEPIAYIVTIETDEYFCYVVISKHGKVGLYSGKLKLLTEYDVFFNRTGISRRVRNVWITAAIYLEDSMDLIITASDRSIMVYGASTLCHVPTFLITGISSVPKCLAYSTSDDKTKKSHLIIGDDLGGLTVISFKQPKSSLFFKKLHDKLNEYFWIDLQSSIQEPYCEIKFHRRIHTRSIKMVTYLKYNDSIVSCSNDPNASLIIRHIRGIRDPYVFKVNRGISCFHYSESLGILATGGSDTRVRLWEPVFPSKPSVIFPVQNSPLMDLVILAHIHSVLSFNKNGVLKIWNIIDEVCIQSIYITFPSFGILGKLIQFGSRSFYCGPARKKGGNDEIELNVKRKLSVPNTSRRSSKMLAEDGGVLKFDHSAEDELKNSSNERNLTLKGISDFNKWKRPEVLVACCNHVAIVPLEEWPSSISNKKDVPVLDCNDSSSGQSQPLLPPPEKMHRPRKPSVWNDEQLQNDFGHLRHEPIQSMDRLGVPDMDQSDDEKNNISNSDSDDHSLEELLKKAGLEGILEKRFLGKFELKNALNMKLALQKPKLEEMKIRVAQGAPYTALDLQEPEDITFSVPLPLSTRMQKKSGMEYFTDPQHILRNNSCFSMTTPRSVYSVTSKTTQSSKK